MHSGQEKKEEGTEDDNADVKRALERIRPKFWPGRNKRYLNEHLGEIGVYTRSDNQRNNNNGNDDAGDNNSTSAARDQRARRDRAASAEMNSHVQECAAPNKVMARRLCVSQSPNMVTVFELDNYEEFLPGLGKTEALVLSHVIFSSTVKANELSKARKQSGGQKKERTPNQNHNSADELYEIADEDDQDPASMLDRFVQYCRTWDQSEHLRAEKEFQAQRNALERRWYCNRKYGCTRLFCSCWSCTCLESRHNWTSSRTMTAGLNGELAAKEWGCSRTNKNPGTKPNALYTLRWAIHAGSLPSLGLAFIFAITTLALGLAALYQANECFIEPWEMQMAKLVDQSGINASGYPSDAVSPAPAAVAARTFNQALSSSFVQLATGSPSDPMRYDSSACAVLTLLASAINLFFRIVLFSVFLHMLERAKPRVIFSPQLCMFLRNGQPVIQARMICPSVVAMHVKSCEWTMVMRHRTIEGEVYGRIEKLSAHCPPFLAMPICTTHTINEHSQIWQHFAEHGSLPGAIITIKVGLWDVVSSQYCQLIRAFSLKRDLRMFRHFDDTIPVGLAEAWKKNSRPVYDMAGFLTTHEHVSRDPEALSALKSPDSTLSDSISRGSFSMLELDSIRISSRRQRRMSVTVV